MNKDHLHREFLPKELVIKLYTEIPKSDFNEKIKLIKEYCSSIEDSYDPIEFSIRLNKQIAHCYMDAEKYSEAIDHFEKVIEQMKLQDDPSEYFLELQMLMRCNRLISYYEESLKWAQLAFDTIDEAHSFQKLNILNEYVDLLIDSKKAFESTYLPLIKHIIDDLGFPEKLGDPVKTIKSLRNTNLKWNRKLSEIVILDIQDKKLLIQEYEKYMESCPIQWYKSYASDTIERLKLD